MGEGEGATMSEKVTYTIWALICPPLEHLIHTGGTYGLMKYRAKGVNTEVSSGLGRK